MSRIIPTPPSRIALHEAAHAVTAEIIRPGCVEHIQTDPDDPQTKALSTVSWTADAYTRWWSEDFSFSEFGAVVFAGMWAERKSGDPDWVSHCKGDMWAASAYVPVWIRSGASKRAKNLVEKHWDKITAVAKVVDSRPITFGDDIREAMRNA